MFAAVDACRCLLPPVPSPSPHTHAYTHRVGRSFSGHIFCTQAKRQWWWHIHARQFDLKGQRQPYWQMRASLANISSLSFISFPVHKLSAYRKLHTAVCANQEAHRRVPVWFLLFSVCKHYPLLNSSPLFLMPGSFRLTLNMFCLRTRVIISPLCFDHLNKCCQTHDTVNSARSQCMFLLTVSCHFRDVHITVIHLRSVLGNPGCTQMKQTAAKHTIHCDHTVKLTD